MLEAPRVKCKFILILDIEIRFEKDTVYRYLDDGSGQDDQVRIIEGSNLAV